MYYSRMATLALKRTASRLGWIDKGVLRVEATNFQISHNVSGIWVRSQRTPTPLIEVKTSARLSVAGNALCPELCRDPTIQVHWGEPTR